MVLFETTGWILTTDTKEKLQEILDEVTIQNLIFSDKEDAQLDGVPKKVRIRLTLEDCEE